MTEKTLPFSLTDIQQWTKSSPTPFYVYDRAAIESKALEFKSAFDWVPGGFINYFAVKALPNPHILSLLKNQGMGADCSSLPELLLAERAGIAPQNIIFTSNDTPANEYKKAAEMGVIINFDDLSHLSFFEKNVGPLPSLICMRYNPGPLKEGNALIGKPEEAKYGFTREQIIEGYRYAREKGVKRFGLHTMVASNELSNEYFVETARLLFELAVEIKQKTGVTVEFINLGGGIGIPYRPEQTAVDLLAVSRGIKEHYQHILTPAGLGQVRLCTENGRVVTGPYGYLITRVIHEKNTYKHYLGLDACMANLMRPGMYGAYHHITIPGKENQPRTQIYDVTGSLCENNDKFAIDRPLPPTSPGDFLVIHDSGAHGHAMGFNYNGKLRSAEFLMQSDKTLTCIRRAETVDDLFATLNLDKA